jgi:hypothetical protein
LSAAADLCLQVSADRKRQRFRQQLLRVPKRKRPDRRHRDFKAIRAEMSFPYSARIARPNSNAGEFGYRSEDCVVQLHKGHSGWSTDSHVTDVVASHHRGQRLALRNPRQRLIPLTLGALRLPSKPYSPCLRTNQASSVRLRIRWRSNSANPRLLFALTTATIC